MYTGEANQNGKRYVFSLEWYAPAENMTGTFTGDQIADYTYNGGLIVNNMPKLATEIVADEVFFVDSKSESTANPGEHIPGSYTSTPAEAPKFEEIDTGEDFPF